MLRPTQALAATAAVAVLLSGGAIAFADPGEEHGHDGIPVPAPALPLTPPGITGFGFLDAIDNDGTTNSDLAFYGDTAYVGYYDGFRIVDISDPTNLDMLSDTKCRANQGDVSVFQTRDGRRILLQSIDRPVTAPDCSGVDTPTIAELEGPDGQYTEDPANAMTRNRARFGYEGLRMFDVTDPANPQYLRFYRTACGSHTHTLVPDPRNGMVHAYIASYPSSTNVTPQVDRAVSDELGLTCEAPHQKISIVHIPLKDPEAGTVTQKALSSDSEPYDGDGEPRVEDGVQHGNGPPYIACHDHQAFLARNIMVGACAGDAQYWSIKRRGNPTSADGEPHTHIKREDGTTESFDFIHNAVVTWDAKVVAITDESGGGVEARCDGPNTVRGFTFFYPLVEPGQAVDGFDDLQGRYSIPRPQNPELCVSHNGSVVPTKDGRYLYAQAFYQGGNSLYDFTDPAAPQELGYADLEDDLGKADSWSTYFYNGTVFVNGGLNRRGATANRGFEAYSMDTGARGSPASEVGVVEPADPGGVPGSVGRGWAASRGETSRLTLVPRRAARRRTAGRCGSPARSRRRARQHRDRLVVADELGDRALAEPARHADDRLDDELVGAAAGVGDEVAVDLQVRDGQVLEVEERAEAGAEVVDRQPAAERRSAASAKRRASSIRAIVAVSVISKTSRDGSAPVRVSSRRTSASRSWSSIDAPETFTANVRSRVGRDEPDRLADDPVIDRVDEAKALGDVEERARVGQACRPVRAGAAAARSARRPVAERQDRLAVQLEAVVVQRVADALLPGHLGAPGAGRDVGVDDVAVASVRLGLVHRAVAGDEDVLAGAARGVEGDRADADGDADEAAAERKRVVAHRLHEVGGDGARLVGARASEQQRELVAADAREHVGRAHPPLEHRRHAAQELVAGRSARACR